MDTPTACRYEMVQSILTLLEGLSNADINYILRDVTELWRL